MKKKDEAPKEEIRHEANLPQCIQKPTEPPKEEGKTIVKNAHAAGLGTLGRSDEALPGNNDKPY